MKGVWLNRSAAASAIGVSPFAFAQKHLPHLRMKVDPKHSKKKLVFVPLDKMTDMSKESYKDMICEEDELSAQVSDIIGDVTDFGEVNYTDPGSELQAARLDNLKARTALINEKLEARKSELFIEWSERFFTIFSSSFSKFKNELIALHLTEEQLDILNEKLETALASMQDGIEQINAEWMNDEEDTTV